MHAYSSCLVVNRLTLCAASTWLGLKYVRARLPFTLPICAQTDVQPVNGVQHCLQCSVQSHSTIQQTLADAYLPQLCQVLGGQLPQIAVLLVPSQACCTAERVLSAAGGLLLLLLRLLSKVKYQT